MSLLEGEKEREREKASASWLVEASGQATAKTKEASGPATGHPGGGGWRYWSLRQSGAGLVTDVERQKDYNY